MGNIDIANLNRPTLFDDYVGQKGNVNYLKSIIKHNTHPNGLLISGPPGIGKTTVAHLYVKATLCENRLEDSYKACGICNSCLKNIEKGEHPNVTYYRITEASVFKEAVNDLINITKASPTITHDNIRNDNHKRFILIDEVQSASKQSISPFLDSLEFAVDNVIVVLISMDLNKMDSIVRDAIESRCIELRLSKLSNEEISNKIISIYPQLNKECAEFISYLCDGNMRTVWRRIEFLSGLYSLNDLSLDKISQVLLNGFSKDKCQELFYSLQSKSWNDTKIILKIISNYQEDIIKYFIQNILDLDLNKEGILLISNLSYWLQSDFKIPIEAIFRVFQGKVLINNSKECIPVISSLPVKKETTFTQSIGDQLQRILGKDIVIKEEPLIVCKALYLNKWSLLLKHYADY